MHSIRRIILALLCAMALPSSGGRYVVPGLVGAVVVAGVIDAVLLGRRRGSWEYPSGAVLTVLIVAMVLSPQEPWYVGACTAALAVTSKYLLRTRTANMFNPAAVALVITYYVFNTGQSWWGALPELRPAVALPALFLAGVFITDRVNKVPLALAFLGTYFALFTASAFAGNPARVAEIYRTPDVQAVLYFVFFILTDPPTSPVKYRDQFACGVLVGVSSFAIFEFTGATHYLLSGVLVGNAWEASRRGRLRR